MRRWLWRWLFDWNKHCHRWLIHKLMNHSSVPYPPSVVLIICSKNRTDTNHFFGIKKSFITTSKSVIDSNNMKSLHATTFIFKSEFVDITLKPDTHSFQIGYKNGKLGRHHILATDTGKKKSHKSNKQAQNFRRQNRDSQTVCDGSAY